MPRTHGPSGVLPWWVSAVTVRSGGPRCPGGMRAVALGHKDIWGLQRPYSRESSSSLQCHVGAHGGREEGHLACGQPHPAVGPAGKLQPGRGESQA